MPKNWKLVPGHRTRTDDASDTRSTAGNPAAGNKKPEKAKLDPKDYPGRFPDGDLSVDLGSINEALGLTANGEGIPRIDAHPGAFPPSMIQLMNASQSAKAEYSNNNAGPSNTSAGPPNASAVPPKAFAGPPSTYVGPFKASTGPSSTKTGPSNTFGPPNTSGQPNTSFGSPSTNISLPPQGFAGMSQQPQQSAPAGPSNANAATGNGGVATGALNGLAGVPMNAGQQMDVNFLYKRVCELSDVLKENRERTQGIIDGAEELAVSEDDA